MKTKKPNNNKDKEIVKPEKNDPTKEDDDNDQTDKPKIKDPNKPDPTKIDDPDKVDPTRINDPDKNPGQDPVKFI
jgi:hypothetical protein